MGVQRVGMHIIPPHVLSIENEALVAQASSQRRSFALISRAVSDRPAGDQWADERANTGSAGNHAPEGCPVKGSLSRMETDRLGAGCAEPWAQDAPDAQLKVSNNPRFVEKLENVVRLYLKAPEHAFVLCCDENSQVQALDRTQPGLPFKKDAREV